VSHHFAQFAFIFSINLFESKEFSSFVDFIVSLLFSGRNFVVFSSITQNISHISSNLISSFVTSDFFSSSDFFINLLLTSLFLTILIDFESLSKIFNIHIKKVVFSSIEFFT